MRFLNPLLLFGITALAIPLAIHLWNRRRIREVQWGAVHLLHHVARKNYRRLRWEQLFLLMLRIGIPVLLALLMAKPVLTRTITWLKDERVSTLFLIDDSYSMQAIASNAPGAPDAPGAAPSTHIALAKQSIAKITENLKQGSDTAALLAGGQRPHRLLDGPTTRRSEFVEQVEGVLAHGNPLVVSAAIQASLAELDQMDNVAREVIVVSDFQTNDWTTTAAQHQNTIRAIDSLSEGKAPIHLTLLRVSNNADDQPRENLAVIDVTTSSPVVGVNQKITLRTTIENFGQQTYPDLQVDCKIDGKQYRSSRITIGPRQKAQALFTFTFERAGSHTVEMQIEPDGLEVDNKYVTVVTVWDRLPTLLLVNREDLQSPPLQGDADFVELALQPHESSKSNPSGLKDLVVTRKMSEDRADGRDYSETRVVVMTNVKQLHGGLQRLEEFVDRGGGLLIFLGGETDVNWYNREMFQNGEGLLPLPIKAVDGEGVDGATAAQATIKAEEFDHPALAFFNDPRNGTMSRVRFTRWFRLGLDDNVPVDVKRKVASNASVMARLNQGDPFLVEKTFGQGRVIVAAVPADTEWGSLPTHPLFVPLMQRLVTNLAASVVPPRNLSPGDKLVHLLPHNQTGKTIRLLDPTGKEHKRKVKDEQQRGRIEFLDTRTPGVYQLTDATGQIENYVVNLNRSESDLSLLSERALRDLSEELDAPVANGWQAYLDLDRQRRLGTGIWRPLIWILLAFLFLEVLFQQWISRRKLG